MWRLKRKNHWPQDHINLIRRILTLSKNGVKVIYVIGNHDSHLIRYITKDQVLNFGKIDICRRVIYNNCLVIHGDQFDPYKLLANVGDFFYGIACIFIKRSACLKNKIKKYFQDKAQMRAKAIKVIKESSYDCIICCHTHVPEISDLYINCGDMIENFTIVEFDNDGTNPRLVNLLEYNYE
jgi:UDP-2,3-diacylglucosamine pyrophosphatase LpxH